MLRCERSEPRSTQARSQTQNGPESPPGRVMFRGKNLAARRQEPLLSVCTGFAAA
ncbi:CUB and Sushi multiple domains 1-like protein [Ancylobacter novellus DSM 506]|uniref:CUB and Sushi multiple domains 1-like protein n=1 Tax=Ancylobacter novellus (strain ATCC 8093 / DSM 506 / JCM 20403 / CCM 1077 / IAM 12100 / NBRC 12443 / NCIMB 10456) TaxID=639283 RepID=D7A8P4_ANCN5|nr:CUB and Sushi multiple domains 1-like protein [Ancylobacter novellus DSM 506]